MVVFIMTPAAICSLGHLSACLFRLYIQSDSPGTRPVYVSARKAVTLVNYLVVDVDDVDEVVQFWYLRAVRTVKVHSMNVEAIAEQQVRLRN